MVAEHTLAWASSSAQIASISVREPLFYLDVYYLTVRLTDVALQDYTK